MIRGWGQCPRDLIKLGWISCARHSERSVYGPEAPEINIIKCVLLAEAQHWRLHGAFGWI